MDEIKEAFSKVKNDIDALKKEINLINSNSNETRTRLIELCNILNDLNKKITKIKTKEKNKLNGNEIIFNENYELIKDLSTISSDTYSDNSLDKQTLFETQNSQYKTNTPNFQTNQRDIKARKDQISMISKGNQGVQTDRQTDRQTNEQMENKLDNVLNTLESLDTIKKEIRMQFKRLTDQELLIFSTIYQLSEEYGYSDYKMLANKLNLTESSIRDYIRRLIAKDIPIEKTKINNKEIQLNISSNLKKIASLNTILSLIELK